MTKVAEELEKYKNGEISIEELYEEIRWCTEEIKEKIVDQSRWFTFYEYIVKDDENRYWSFGRAMGSTEYQEHDEFNPSTIQEVEPYEKVIIDYKPKNKS